MKQDSVLSLPALVEKVDFWGQIFDGVSQEHEG